MAEKPVNVKHLSRIRALEEVSREVLTYLERLPINGATKEVITKLQDVLYEERDDCVFEGRLVLPAGTSLLEARIQPRVLTLKTSAPRRHDAEILEMLRGRGLQMPITETK